MKNFKKIGVCLLIALLWVTVGFYSHSQKSYAYVAQSEAQIKNADYNFVNAVTIEGNIGGQVVTFKGDPNAVWIAGVDYKAQNYDCTAKITFTGFSILDLETNPGVVNGKQADVNVDYNPNSSKCTSTNPDSFKKSIGNTDMAGAFFTQTDPNTISSVISKDTYSLQGQSTYFKTSEKTCVDRIVENSGGITYFELDANKGIKVDGATLGIGDIGSCKVERINFQTPKDANDAASIASNSIALAGVSSSASCSSIACRNTSGSGQTQVGAAAGSSPGDACGNSGWALSWLACPVLEAAAGLANTLIGLFENELSFTINDLNHNNGQDSLKKAWTIFKDISSALFVILMLVIVLSEAISFGPFDAYTVRKMLPRLIIAIVLMQLSWTLIAWVVNLINDVGTGLADLMYLPFGGAKAMTFDALLANAGVGDGAASALGWGGIVAGIAVAAIAPFTVLIGAFTAIVSLLVGLAALVFRKILIMMALVFAPVALAAWILPGTKKYYDMWYSNLSKALMMFPLAVALVASGRIFAFVSGTQTSPFLGFLVVLVGFFGPLFILPKSYKWGGQLMQQAGGFISTSANKLSEAPKGYLNRRKESLQLQRERESGARIARGKEKWYYGDQFKSGKWDPLLGKPGSRRRLRHRAAFVSKGVNAEHEDIKAAGDLMQLQIQRLHPDDKDDFVRARARGKSVVMDEVTGRVKRDADDNPILVVDPKVSDLEKRAALDKLAVLGGAGNFRAIEQAHMEALRSKDTHQIEMINEFESDNVSTLFPKLPHLYKTVNGTAPSQPEAIAQMHGAEIESMLAQMSTAIASNPPGSDKHNKAVKALQTFLGNYEQAASSDVLRGRLDTLGTQAVRAFVARDMPRIQGINDTRGKFDLEGIKVGAAGTLDLALVNRLASMINPATGVVKEPGTISGNPAAPHTGEAPETPAPDPGVMSSRRGGAAAGPAAAPHTAGTGGAGGGAEEHFAAGEAVAARAAAEGTSVTVDIDHAAISEAVAKGVREGIRTAHAEGDAMTPKVDTEEGERGIIKPGDPDFHPPRP